ncbi:type II toxin-antitoxin system RelE/ParE family toxin [Mucilaginibacter paludis]|uniref:Plasmid stabilization system n=1 Tax=Mucilaginibacter paludis DSM 18603 TaxID=714943 RepID=H1YDE9_9SPHI|nr:type II toxin-antitoxin system RelE/ParE family toxin [Mucilaginibacter paludis]EHQ30158.1 plasmid stabilization system [Mucilaginibacter paludis DSM 18603]
MAKIIVWTKRANHSFNCVINYLENEWNEKVTKSFVIRTYKVIELLADNPEIGTIENYDRKIRGFLIIKHNILFYRVTDTEIILLNMYDTRSNPIKPKF